MPSPLATCGCSPPCIPVGRSRCRRYDAFRRTWDALQNAEDMLVEFCPRAAFARLLLHELEKEIAMIELGWRE